MGFRTRLHKQVFGQGPQNARILVVGDRPGKEEMIHGFPFAGRTGDELNRKLWDINVDRGALFLANLLVQPPAGKEVTPEEIKRDEVYLWEILDTHRFELIVTLGATATKYFLGPDAGLERTHAIAHELRFMYRCGLSHTDTVVFPSFHLAAGFHTPALQPYIEYDFQILGNYIKGSYQPPAVDSFKGKEDYFCIRGADVDRLLSQYDDPCRVAIDTEGVPGAPWGLSFSLAPGTAYVVKAGDGDGLRALGAWLQAKNPQIILHNSLYDIGMLREMGIDVSELRIVDTMIMAFLLQIESQGLKPLSFRHSGMEMEAFDETVGPFQKDAAINYLMRAVEWFSEHEPVAEKVAKKPGKKTPRKKKAEEDPSNGGLTWPSGL